MVVTNLHRVGPRFHPVVEEFARGLSSSFEKLAELVRVSFLPTWKSQLFSFDASARVEEVHLIDVSRWGCPKKEKKRVASRVFPLEE